MHEGEEGSGLLNSACTDAMVNIRPTERKSSMTNIHDRSLEKSQEEDFPVYKSQELRKRANTQRGDQGIIVEEKEPSSSNRDETNYL